MLWCPTPTGEARRPGAAGSRLRRGAAHADPGRAVATAAAPEKLCGQAAKSSERARVITEGRRATVELKGPKYGPGIQEPYSEADCRARAAGRGETDRFASARPARRSAPKGCGRRSVAARWHYLWMRSRASSALARATRRSARASTARLVGPVVQPARSCLASWPPRRWPTGRSSCAKCPGTRSLCPLPHAWASPLRGRPPNGT